MITAQAAISRARRDLILGLILKGLLGGALFCCLLIGPEGARLVLLSVVGVVWFALNFSSARGSRLASMSSPLIAAGQFEEAEQQIDEAVRAFSVFKNVKLQTLQCLAQLRYAQRRWPETALLCRAVLGPRLVSARQMNKQCRLILADSLLEMNEVSGAWDAMSGLYTQRLSLGEVLELLLIQLDYSSRIGGWAQMFDQIATKVQLAELMPAPRAARAQALLALAARYSGREDWEKWLRARSELIADAEQLCIERPILRELWPKSGDGLSTPDADK